MRSYATVQTSESDGGKFHQPCSRSLVGFPPTTLITAEIDSLHWEGEAFAKRLQHDAVPVAYRHYIGVTHEFFGMGAVLAEAKDAQAFASSELHKAFAPPVNPLFQRHPLLTRSMT